MKDETWRPNQGQQQEIVDITPQQVPQETKPPEEKLSPRLQLVQNITKGNFYPGAGKKSWGKLTPKQARFAAAFAKHGVVSKAVKEALGGSISNGAVQMKGNRMMGFPQVQEEIKRLLDEAGLTGDMIAKKWKQALYMGWGQDAKHKDALRALETISKMRGYMVDKSAHLRVNVQAKVAGTEYDQLLKDYEKLRTVTDGLVKDQ